MEKTNLMHIFAVLLIIAGIAAFVGYAIGRVSGDADEQSDAMQVAMLQEKADAEAWERITKRSTHGSTGQR